MTVVELRIAKKGIGKELAPSVKTMADSWTPLTLGSSMAESVLRTLIELSRNKEIVDIFQNRLNESVSAGDAVYTQQGIGQETLDAVRSESRMPKTMPHLRDCFMSFVLRVGMIKLHSTFCQRLTINVQR